MTDWIDQDGTEIDEKINEAVRVREEEGDPARSAEMLDNMLQATHLYENERLIYGQLGLSLMQMGNLDDALFVLQKLEREVRKRNDKERLAEANRHLSSVCLLLNAQEDGDTGFLFGAYTHARGAYELASEVGRNDLPWFAEGVLAVAVQKGEGLSAVLQAYAKAYEALAEASTLVPEEISKEQFQIWELGINAHYYTYLEEWGLVNELERIALGHGLKGRAARIRQMIPEEHRDAE